MQAKKTKTRQSFELLDNDISDIEDSSLKKVLLGVCAMKKKIRLFFKLRKSTNGKNFGKTSPNIS